MSNPRGFGPPKSRSKSQSKVSQRAQERAAAAKRMDKMKSQGMPEFEIYLRIKGKPNWVPVGAITVPRSNLVSRAIYANEKPLLETAFRMVPMMKKHQDSLEYGYRLKEFKDEEIQVAQRPTGLGSNALGNVLGNALGQVGQRLGGLFKPKS